MGRGTLCASPWPVLETTRVANSACRLPFPRRVHLSVDEGPSSTSGLARELSRRRARRGCAAKIPTPGAEESRRRGACRTQVQRMGDCIEVADVRGRLAATGRGVPMTPRTPVICAASAPTKCVRRPAQDAASLGILPRRSSNPSRCTKRQTFHSWGRSVCDVREAPIPIFTRTGVG